MEQKIMISQRFGRSTTHYVSHSQHFIEYKCGVEFIKKKKTIMRCKQIH
jgi:hypothetical protein